jgi:hypothetical protein
MSNFTKTEYFLYNYKNIKAEINNIELEIKEIQHEYTGANAINFDEKSGHTFKFNSSVENEVIWMNFEPVSQMSLFG